MQAKVIATKDNYAKIQMLDGSIKPNQTIQISVGKQRTQNQNNLYWKFLTWCIDNGLKEHGHFSVEALHADLKAHFLSSKVYTEGEFKVIDEASTASLSKIAFGEYFEKVNQFMPDSSTTSLL